MSDTKKQHYVPQFLLRKYGVGKKKKEKLWVLDKRTENVYQSSVKDVGHENRFYQYVNDDDVLDPEELLENVETRLIEEAIETNYEKAGKVAAYKKEISKQYQYFP